MIAPAAMLAVVALKDAYPNRLPFVAVNTMVHELLHVIRGDIFLRRGGLLNGADHEAAVDWQATQLWIQGSLPGIKRSAGTYVQKLVEGTSP